MRGIKQNIRGEIASFLSIKQQYPKNIAYIMCSVVYACVACVRTLTRRSTT